MQCGADFAIPAANVYRFSDLCAILMMAGRPFSPKRVTFFVWSVCILMRYTKRWVGEKTFSEQYSLKLCAVWWKRKRGRRLVAVVVTMTRGKWCKADYGYEVSMISRNLESIHNNKQKSAQKRRPLNFSLHTFAEKRPASRAVVYVIRCTQCRIVKSMLVF